MSLLCYHYLGCDKNRDDVRYSALNEPTIANSEKQFKERSQAKHEPGGWRKTQNALFSKSIGTSLAENWNL